MSHVRPHGESTSIDLLSDLSLTMVVRTLRPTTRSSKREPIRSGSMCPGFSQNAIFTGEATNSKTIAACMTGH
nr:hypothetical protein CFP56_60743 [Quercus suber]